MSAHQPELINALLDGELRGMQRWIVQRHVSGCPLCATEYRRLQHVRQMLAAHPTAAQMSDSPEFFWSKVKREIETRGGQTVEMPAEQSVVSNWIRQHAFELATATAAFVVGLVVFGLSMFRQSPADFVANSEPQKPPTIIQQVATVLPNEGTISTASAPTSVEEVSTTLPNVVASVVGDHGSEPTVIWVSGLPWTSDMDDLKTVYANLNI